MDKFSAFESFVAAIESGSLSGAARKRNLSQPAISQQVSALEADLGVKLLHRGRGGVKLTRSGEVVFRHARIILRENENLMSGLASLSGRISGRLTVTANMALSQELLADVIVSLRQLHPDLEVILRPDPRVLDIVAEGIDIALRNGSPGQGTGVVRRIGSMTILNVATPQYLDSVGRPSAPEELAKLDYIQFKVEGDTVSMPLMQGDQVVQTPVKIGFTAQYPDLVTKALEGHLGFTRVPEFMVAEDIARGKYEVVLPQWSVPDEDLFIVFPAAEQHTPSHAAFIKALIAKMSEMQGTNVLSSAARAFA